MCVFVEKRKRYSGYSDDDTEPEISSEDEVEPTEKDYDSDRDPVWRPSSLVNPAVCVHPNLLLL